MEIKDVFIELHLGSFCYQFNSYLNIFVIPYRSIWQTSTKTFLNLSGIWLKLQSEVNLSCADPGLFPGMCVCDPPPSPYHSSISRGIQLISGDGVSKPSFYASLMTFNYFGISLGGGSGSSTGSPPQKKTNKQKNKKHTHTRGSAHAFGGPACIIMADALYNAKFSWRNNVLKEIVYFNELWYFNCFW